MDITGSTASVECAFKNILKTCSNKEKKICSNLGILKRVILLLLLLSLLFVVQKKSFAKDFQKALVCSSSCSHNQIQQ